MGNMGYCRFRNTLKDLQDCFDHWDEVEESGADYTEDNEARARKWLLELCQKIVENYGDD